MSRNQLAERDSFIGGIGFHPYQRRSDTTYVTLGLTAAREALADAGVAWTDVQSAYSGTALLGMGSSRIMLSRLGSTGIPMAQVENAAASGSTAVAQACLEVASGQSDLVLALGVDKPRGGLGAAPGQAGIENLEGGTIVPFTHFALLASEYMDAHGVSAEQVAGVALKKQRNGSLNPNAQSQNERTLEEILAEPISGSMTRLQCCPVGEGAAAVVVASGDAIDRLGIDRRRAVRVLSSVTRTERLYGPGEGIDAALTAETAGLAFDAASVDPRDVDVVLRGMRKIRDVAAQPALARHIVREVRPGPEATSDEDLLNYVRDSAQTSWHPISSCRMGRGDDDVVDHELRVRGIDKLRVIDSSIMPNMPSSNTNAGAIMIGEKGADLVKEAWAS